MTVFFIILFITAFGFGSVAFLVSDVQRSLYKLGLVFAGAYLFAITVTHILPELYYNAENPTTIGVYVLLGFFLQQLLEYFSGGAEHGHIHKHTHEHKQSLGSALPVIIALSIHALLEGTLLAHPGTIHEDHDAKALLFGIVLHKGPAAFALVTILLCHLKSRKVVLIFLVAFSLASPLGIILGNYIVSSNNVWQQAFTVLFGLVSGNFLHISTTIVFESSADHSFNIKKLGVAVFGALVAVAAEAWL